MQISISLHIEKSSSFVFIYLCSLSLSSAVYGIGAMTTTRCSSITNNLFDQDIHSFILSLFCLFSSSLYSFIFNFSSSWRLICIFFALLSYRNLDLLYKYEICNVYTQNTPHTHTKEHHNHNLYSMIDISIFRKHHSHIKIYSLRHDYEYFAPPPHFLLAAMTC